MEDGVEAEASEVMACLWEGGLVRPECKREMWAGRTHSRGIEQLRDVEEGEDV